MLFTGIVVQWYSGILGYWWCLVSCGVVHQTASSDLLLSYPITSLAQHLAYLHTDIYSQTYKRIYTPNAYMQGLVAIVKKAPSARIGVYVSSFALLEPLEGLCEYLKINSNSNSNSNSNCPSVDPGRLHLAVTALTAEVGVVVQVRTRIGGGCTRHLNLPYPYPLSTREQYQYFIDYISGCLF